MGYAGDYLGQLMNAVYDDLNLWVAGRKSGFDFVKDHNQANQLLANPEMFEKDYGLVALLATSRFNAPSEIWAKRASLSQKQLSGMSAAHNHDFIRDAFSAMRPQENDLRDMVLAASFAVLLKALNISPSIPDLLAWSNQARGCLETLQYLSLVAPTDAQLQEATALADKLRGDFEQILKQDPAAAELLASFNSAIEQEAGIKDGGTQELLMIILGGTETTTNSVLWSLEILARNAELQDMLCQQLETDTGIERLDSFILEVLRKFPPVPLLSRKVTEDCEVDGLQLRKSQIVMISVPHIHHDADYWDQPLTFNASRPVLLDKSYDKKRLIPFITGQRACGGMRLALVELRQALSAILRKYRVSQPNQNLSIGYALTTYPSTWPSLTLIPRDPAGAENLQS